MKKNTNAYRLARAFFAIIILTPLWCGFSLTAEHAIAHHVIQFFLTFFGVIGCCKIFNGVFDLITENHNNEKETADE